MMGQATATAAALFYTVFADTLISVSGHGILFLQIIPKFSNSGHEKYKTKEVAK